MNKKLWLLIVLGGLILFLPGIKNRWTHAVYLSKYYSFSLLNESESGGGGQAFGVTLAQAEEIQTSNRASDSVMSMTFYIEKDEQMIRNQSIGRAYPAKVYQVSGSSSLLFPHDTLLPADDAAGCLISAALAFQLFGEASPQGVSLNYQEKEYTVRGVLNSKEPIFVSILSGQPEQLVNAMIFRADDYQMKESFKEQLTGVYGLLLKEELTDFQTFVSIPERMPNRMSDFAEWERFFKF